MGLNSLSLGFVQRDYPLAVGSKPVAGESKWEYTPQRKKRRRPVTVCIAAICSWYNQTMIVGASDRKLTYGDIEFERTQTKVFHFVPNIVALVAGDATIQHTLCDNTLMEVVKPQSRTLSVSEVANAFAEQFVAYRKKVTEKKILLPLGLDLESFASASQNMSTDLAMHLATELLNFDLGVETLVTGVDSTGAHIYTINNPGLASCNDAVGFAAIGIGDNHALAQFMFSRYTRWWVFQRALLLTYSAKRRAEAAPGVGKETDLFYIGPHPQPFLYATELGNEIHRIYEALQTEQIKATNSAMEGADAYIQQLIDKAKAEAEAENQKGSGKGETASDQIEIRGDSKESQPP